ncbi:MAG: hypothetical protein ACR2F8_10400 [Caulobacteraceae bacterium]
MMRGSQSSLSGSLALKFMFVGEVVTNDATGRRAKKGMVVGIVARYAADYRAFHAALGVGGSRTRQD